jgi:hypothetical protein
MPFTPAGKVASAITMAALVFSMTSCGTQVGPPDDLSEFYGLIINSDVSSNLLGGIRLESGETVSLYGRFNADGGIQELEEVVYADAQGQESSLQFASGRPILALLHDGSRVDVTYDEVTPTRLTGIVKVFIAGTGETHEAPFEVDLEIALAQLAEMVEDLTGGGVQIAEQAGASTTARLADTMAMSKNGDVRQQIGLGHLLFGAIIAGAGFLMVCSMVQMMDAMLLVVEASMHVMIVAIFMPLIIMGEICRLAAGEPWITIDIEIRPSWLPARHGS